MSIVVASPSDEFAKRLHDSFGAAANGNSRFWSDGLKIADLPKLAERMIQAEPRVVVVGPGLYDEAALQLIKECDDRRPDIVTVLVADPSADLWPAAVRAGARDVIAPNATDDVLQEAIGRALRTAEQRHTSLMSAANPTPRARVISVVSPKGGAGKTTIATNLAVGLARAVPGEVVLIDLDLQFGGIAGALRMAPERSIADAATIGSALDGGMLKVLLTPHPTGLFALCAPESLAQADDVDAQHLSNIISLLSDDFRYVIIDTAAGIDVVTLAAIELATDLVLVSTTDVPCVRALRRATDALSAVGLGTQVRHFVLNRADVKGGLAVSDIEAVTGMEVDVSIPDSRAVAMSLNLGSPILESEPKSVPSKAFGELVGPFLRAVDEGTTRDEEGKRRVRHRQKVRS